MEKKGPKDIIENILKEIEKVGFEFENHPDFKETISFEIKDNLIRRIKSAIKVLSVEE